MDPVPPSFIQFVRVKQPVLPPRPGGEPWPASTRAWWKLWGKDPKAEHFGATDWDFLADTAVVHAAVWGDADLKQLPELRLRVAKMGATAEDRLRLRMHYAEVEDDGHRSSKVDAEVAAEYGHLRAVARPG